MRVVYDKAFFFRAPMLPDAAARSSRWNVGHSM